MEEKQIKLSHSYRLKKQSVGQNNSGSPRQFKPKAFHHNRRFVKEKFLLGWVGPGVGPGVEPYSTMPLGSIPGVPEIFSGKKLSMVPRLMESAAA